MRFPASGACEWLGVIARTIDGNVNRVPGIVFQISDF